MLFIRYAGLDPYLLTLRDLIPHQVRDDDFCLSVMLNLTLHLLTLRE